MVVNLDMINDTIDIFYRRNMQLFQQEEYLAL